jgi:hypothetical protein
MSAPTIRVEVAELDDDRIDALAELLLRLIDDGILDSLAGKRPATFEHTPAVTGDEGETTHGRRRVPLAG